jgi:hypothetical protein
MVLSIADKIQCNRLTFSVQRFGDRRVTVSIHLKAGGQVALELIDNNISWFAETIRCQTRSFSAQKFMFDFGGFNYRATNRLQTERLETIFDFFQQWRPSETA